MRAVIIVSPAANARLRLNNWQNCVTRSLRLTKLADPNESTVQALTGFPVARKTQEKSFSASATSCVGEKSTGTNPGTPPSVHTPGLPSPKGRDASTSTSGRAMGSPGSALNTSMPTALALIPGTASITNWNPAPERRS
jgi:hypothetical protein